MRRPDWHDNLPKLGVEMSVAGVAALCVISALGCLMAVIYNKGNVPFRPIDEEAVVPKKVYRDLLKVRELEEHMDVLSADIERIINVKRQLSDTDVPHCLNARVTAVVPRDYLADMGVPDADY
jgi:hypothetical protein